MAPDPDEPPGPARDPDPTRDSPARPASIRSNRCAALEVPSEEDPR